MRPSGSADLQQNGAGCRLVNFLDPTFAQDRSNFTRHLRNFRRAQCQNSPPIGSWVRRERSRFTVNRGISPPRLLPCRSDHSCRMGLMCHTYDRFRPNHFRMHSTIHRQNTQAVAVTPVALRLLSLTSKRLVTRLLSIVEEWAWRREPQREQRRVPCSAQDVTVLWFPIT